MRRWPTLSIRGKLTATVLLSTLLPVATGLSGLALQEMRELEQDLVASNVLTATTIGHYSAAELAFRDRVAAGRTLEALRRLEYVESAALYDADGALFTSFQRSAAAGIPARLTPPPPSTRVSRVDAHLMDVAHPVQHDGVGYGSILLRISTASLERRVRTYLLTLGLAALAIVMLSVLLALVLGRWITRPILGLAAVARQVTERADYSVRAAKRSEDEVGALCDAFNAMLAELGARQQKAQQAVQARDEFLSIASHELKTPLTSLVLQIQSLRRMAQRFGSLDQAPPDVVAASLEGVDRQLKRLDGLVGNLLDVARITAGRLGLSLEDVDLASLTRDVVERFAQQAAQAGCSLVVGADTPVRGRWDRIRVEQVITNLLSNAVKYGAGGPVEVSVAEVGGQARLAVRDHGMGISPEDVPRIFERFERAVPARHYGGLGLGLFITRQIVTAHGGTISVTSQPGQGSTFTVDLPLAVPAPGSPAA
ncbi:MAG: ATP-binding protein [Myxococcota bacterium]